MNTGNSGPGSGMVFVRHQGEASPFVRLSNIVNDVDYKNVLEQHVPVLQNSGFERPI